MKEELADHGLFEGENNRRQKAAFILGLPVLYDSAANQDSAAPAKKGG